MMSVVSFAVGRRAMYLETKRDLSSMQLDIIVPLFNEADNIHLFLAEVVRVLDALPCSYCILFIDDGSQDATLDILLEMQQRYHFIKIICFTRNFGKEAALTAGLEYAQGGICIPMDADLQHSPALIPDMLRKWEAGCNHVIAVRRSRKTDTILKRMCSFLFYKLFNAMSDIKILSNAGDFRLLDRTIVNRLLQLKERNRFMKGLYAWVGGPVEIIYFEARERFQGMSSFNFRSLLKFSYDALTAFTTIPLRLWSSVGFFICVVSGIYSIYLIINHFLYRATVPGHTSLMLVILFFGGIQLVSLGIIGEYLSRLFIESKRRPIYMVERVYENQNNPIPKPHFDRVRGA